MSAGFSSSDHRLMPPQLSLSHHQQQLQLATLTHRFSRSASLQQHPSFTFKENRVFSGVPESTIDWPEYTHSPAQLPPPFINSDEDAWNLFYAAAGQVAKMQIKMSRRTIAGVSPHLPRSDELELLRQQHFCRNRGVSGVSTWPSPPPVQNQPLQLRRKPPVAGGGNTAAKECAGTGVFLPRRYSDNPPESRKRQACWPANLPTRMTQSSSTVPPQINDNFISHNEMLTGQRKAMILAAQQQHRRQATSTVSPWNGPRTTRMCSSHKNGPIESIVKS